MKRTVSVLVLVVLFCGGTVWADAPAAPAAPAVSTFAPVKDLVSQVPDYVKELEEATADKEEYADNKVKIARDSSTLSVIALTLGLHDKENEYKKAAPALIKACQETANSQSYEAAQAGVNAIKKAIADKSGDPTKLKWEKVAALKELMEAVPLINTKLKRYTKGKRLKSKADKTTGYSSVIAAIAQGSMSSTDETEKPTEVKAWQKYCAQMRDAAFKTNKAILTGEAKTFKKAMTELQKSCDDCHDMFHKVEKTDDDSEDDDE